MSNPLSVGDAAKILGVRPAEITALFYQQKLCGDRCPIIGGRRIIPADYVEIIAMELRRKGIAVTKGDRPCPA